MLKGTELLYIVNSFVILCALCIYIYGMCDYTCFKYTIIYKWNQKDTEKNGVVCCSHHVQKKKCSSAIVSGFLSLVQPWSESAKNSNKWVIHSKCLRLLDIGVLMIGLPINIKTFQTWNKFFDIAGNHTNYQDPISNISGLLKRQHRMRRFPRFPDPLHPSNWRLSE
jgi:hypothetical protein